MLVGQARPVFAECWARGIGVSLLITGSASRKGVRPSRPVGLFAPSSVSFVVEWGKVVRSLSVITLGSDWVIKSFELTLSGNIPRGARNSSAGFCFGVTAKRGVLVSIVSMRDSRSDSSLRSVVSLPFSFDFSRVAISGRRMFNQEGGFREQGG